eukprot:CAMPEP_0206437034 /NCGR_PEP_ID=MMETSP0324_2-20121206/10814_1 /ASSEMBLY_ACC=CAM_ASM_000836 /TAXON_ID=2866 /ORGANISM="Crypthecodinium cohnii, Strain Seligo" /LENGTH=201 /DNA_ID=CAMNT_0053904265 /DNA_START=451 /DNA_END=1056 /DNA_ORIENTATION=+
MRTATPTSDDVGTSTHASRDDAELAGPCARRPFPSDPELFLLPLIRCGIQVATLFTLTIIVVDVDHFVPQRVFSSLFLHDVRKRVQHEVAVFKSIRLAKGHVFEVCLPISRVDRQEGQVLGTASFYCNFIVVDRGNVADVPGPTVEEHPHSIFFVVDELNEMVASPERSQLSGVALVQPISEPFGWIMLCKEFLHLLVHAT